MIIGDMSTSPSEIARSARANSSGDVSEYVPQTQLLGRCEERPGRVGLHADPDDHYLGAVGDVAHERCP